jgi:sec-independent protein translocase protein TatB
MFGIGPEELVVIGLLFLVVFGPGKAASTARDLGRFVNKARDSVEEFKGELIAAEEAKEVRHTVEGFKSDLTSSEEIKEAQRSVEEFKSELVPDKGCEDDQRRKP